MTKDKTIIVMTRLTIPESLGLVINPYPFVLKMLSDFYACCKYTQMHFILNFIVEANNMDPGEQSDNIRLFPWIHIVCNSKQPKKISQERQQFSRRHS